MERLLLLLLSIVVGQSFGVELLPAPLAPLKRFQSDGDLYIGVVQPIFSTKKVICDGTLQAGFVEYTQLLARVFDDFNANRTGTLPPGFRLGFTIMDHCLDDSYALAQTVNFLPAVNSSRYVALICCYSSPQSTMVSTMLSAFRLPQISYSAATDTLSDKTVYKYFLRTVSPDKNQVRALVELMLRMGWTYVQFLYTEGDYGDNAMKKFEELSQSVGICIAYSKRLAQKMVLDDYVPVVAAMVANSKARTVIAFIYNAQMLNLAAQLELQNASTLFQFVGSTTWASGGVSTNLNTTRYMINGSLFFDFLKRRRPEMVDALRPVTPATETRNPWLAQYWDMMFKCKWSSGACNDTMATSAAQSAYTSSFALIYDTATVLVAGLGRYLPKLAGQWGRFNTSDYFAEMLRLDFDGMNGRMSFDENGDAYGGYTIYNYQLDGAARVTTWTVGTWDVLNNMLLLNNSLVHWRNGSLDAPESVCSKPCQLGAIQLQREVVCCWECFPCRENEITDPGRAHCIPCQPFYWPDPTDFLQCIKLVPDFVTFGDPLGISLVAISTLGSLITVATGIVYIWHNNSKLIKASCREASYVLLFGILLNFSCLFAFVVRPDTVVCYVQRFSFHLLSTFIYTPMLIKSVKIFRIFVESKQGIRVPRWLGVKAQIFTMSCIILVEVGILVGTTWITSPDAVLRMPSPNTPYVELTCNDNFTSLIVGLGLNLALVVACSILAFLARKVPQNYNESAQIAFCVYTSLILWTVFIPAFLTTTLAHHHTLLITLSMVVISVVSLCCLFLPKVYALYYVPLERMALEESRSDRVGMRCMPPSSQSRHATGQFHISNGSDRQINPTVAT